MRTVVTVLAVGLLVWTPSAAAAAQAPMPRVQAAAELTLTGCLTRASSDSYILQAADGTKTSVIGPAELAEHIDQTVQIKGTMDRTGSTFRVTAVNAIASSCGA